MALDGQRQLIARQAVAIVGHQDAGEAAAVGLDFQARSPGVQGVLHQLLDRAGRPLDHLAGGDAVDQLHGQAMDGHGPPL